MAKYGQWMLKQLRFQYCDWSGSSRGMREFVEHHLPAFHRANPHLIVRTRVKRNEFPFIEATYGLEGRTVHAVGVKSLDANQILEHARALRDSAGYDKRNRVPPRRIVSRNPSIQGSWLVTTWQQQRQQQQQQQRGSSAAGS